MRFSIYHLQNSQLSLKLFLLLFSNLLKEKLKTQIALRLRLNCWRIMLQAIGMLLDLIGNCIVAYGKLVWGICLLVILRKLFGPQVCPTCRSNSQGVKCFRRLKRKSKNFLLRSYGGVRFRLWNSFLNNNL